MFEIELFIYMQMDLVLNNLQWFICHKTKRKQTKPKQQLRTCCTVNFVISTETEWKQKKKKERQIVRPCQRTKKAVEKLEGQRYQLTTHRTFLKGLEKGLEELEIGFWIEPNETTSFWWSARILRIYQETWKYLLSLKLQWKTISKY